MEIPWLSEASGGTVGERFYSAIEEQLQVEEVIPLLSKKDLMGDPFQVMHTLAGYQWQVAAGFLARLGDVISFEQVQTEIGSGSPLEIRVSYSKARHQAGLDSGLVQVFPDNVSLVAGDFKNDQLDGFVRRVFDREPVLLAFYNNLHIGLYDSAYTVMQVNDLLLATRQYGDKTYLLFDVEKDSILVGTLQSIGFRQPTIYDILVSKTEISDEELIAMRLSNKHWSVYLLRDGPPVLKYIIDPCRQSIVTTEEEVEGLDMWGALTRAMGIKVED